MTARPPSRLALAIFDRCVGNDPLKGDLIEEYDRRQSQWWLWRQVIGSLVCQPDVRSLQPSEGTNMLVLGAAVLVLVSFEAVFVTNLLHRLMFGPSMSAIAGFAYLMQGRPLDPAPPIIVPLASMFASVAALAAAIALGWLITPFHQRHYALSLPVFSLSVMLNAALNLRFPFEAQFLTTLLFVVGLVVGGRLAVRDHTPRISPA